MRTGTEGYTCQETGYGQRARSYKGGSQLSHTEVKPDSHLTWIFCQKFLFLCNWYTSMY